MNLRSVLILIMLNLVMVAPAACANELDELVNWHWQAHEYPTYGGNSYLSYNVYALVRKTDGAYVLFANLGDQALPKFITKNSSCVLIDPNTDGTYGIWGIVASLHTCSEVGGDAAQFATWAEDSRNKWYEYPYSRALCQTMKLNECP